VSNWRYIAQRATTGELLDLEVPFANGSEPTWALSAAGSFKGTVPLPYGQRKALDGIAILDEWNTLLFVEVEGRIRWGGIVIRSEAGDNDWSVEATSYAGYPTGIPYLGEFYGSRQDPADVVREIWRHVQSFDHPSSDLGVTVTGKTSTTVGSDSEAKANAAAAAYADAKRAYESNRELYTVRRAHATDLGKVKSARISDRTAANKALSDAKTTLAAAKRTKDPAQIAAAQATVDTRQRAVNAAIDAVTAATNDYLAADAAADAQASTRDAAKAVADAANDKKQAAAKVMQEDGGAYKMLWWEAPDCGARIKSLADEAPFDYIESHAWNADRTSISHTIQIQYPRAGRRRDDLAFIVGDNITSIADPKTKGDDFANYIFALGNGDGKAMVHTANGIDDGRLRRVNVLSRKETKSKDTLLAKARNARLQATAGLTISSITVRDHANARVGQWALGDDILVQFDIPGLGRQSIWHRVVSWTLTSEHTATLSLERSDSFTYGGLARD
jgi:hypothetical protein